MLFIIYGATAKISDVAQSFLLDQHFEKIQKYWYKPDDCHTESRNNDRTYVTKEYVEACEFKYTNRGMLIGFHKDDVFDAAVGKKNCFMTASPENLDFIEQMKCAFGGYVVVIGLFSDEPTLLTLFHEARDVNGAVLSAAAIDERMRVAQNIKEQYLKKSFLFDHVVIYNGENSVFNAAALCQQLSFIVKTETERQNVLNAGTYVTLPYKGTDDYAFVSYSHADIEPVSNMLTRLQLCKNRIWYDKGIEPGSEWEKIIEYKISHCKVFLLFSSRNSTNTAGGFVESEIFQALHENKKIIRIVMDDSKFRESLQSKLDDVQYVTMSNDDSFFNAINTSLGDSVKVK